MLETANVTACWQLPNNTNGSTMFSPINIRQAGPFWDSINVVTPVWSYVTTPGLVPNCNYSVSSTTTSTTVRY